MPYRSFCAPAVFLFVLVLVPRLSAGALAYTSIDPTRHAELEWEQRPLAGNVVKIESGRELTDSRTGKKVERVFMLRRFSRDAKGSRIEAVGPERSPYHTKVYDPAGRMTRQDGKMMDGSTQKSFTYSEQIGYDADGNITSIELVRDGKVVRKLAGATKSLVGGGKQTVFETTDSQNKPVVLTYDFDEAGRMTRHEQRVGGQLFSLFIITRDERGEIASFKMSENGPPTEFEYKHDAQGNWVRRETFRMENGVRKSAEVEFRRITYGPAVRPPVAQVPQPGNPAAAPANPGRVAAEVNRDALVGTYEGSIGKESEGFHSHTRIELKKDGTLHYVQKDKLKDKTMEKEATGTWSVAAGKVQLRLEKSVKGPQLPPNGLALPMTVGADGKSLVGPDGKRTFKRVG